MPSSHVRAAVLLATCALQAGLAAPLFAQAATPSVHSLDIDVTVSGAYETDDAEQIVTPGFGAQLQPSGYSTIGIGNLQYTRQLQRGRFAAGAGSAVRHSPEEQQPFTSIAHNAFADLTTNVSNRVMLHVNQLVAYSPSYLYGTFPTLPNSPLDTSVTVPQDYDFNVDNSSSYNLGTTVVLTRSMTRHFRVNVQGDFNETNFSKETDLRKDLTTYSIGGGVQRDLTRTTVLALDYRYRTGEGYGAGVTTGEHIANVGFDLSRPLSTKRRMLFSVRLGGSTVDIPESVAEFETGGRQFRVNADFTVLYPFARTWRLRGSYNRGVQYVGGLPEPAFVDGFAGEVGGLMSRRVEFLARFSKSSGESLLATTRSLLDTYAGEVRFTYKLSRQIDTFGEYVAYSYSTQERVLDPGLPPSLNRQGVHAGLTLHVPVSRR